MPAFSFPQMNRRSPIGVRVPRSSSMRIVAILMFVPLLGGYAFGQTNRSSSDSSKTADTPVLCVADARWTNTNAGISYSKQTQLPISITLLAHVSKGSNCADTEIRVTATFLNDTQEFICNGTIPQAMTMSSESQSFIIEIRPFVQNDFF